MLVLKGIIEPFNFSFFSITGWGIDLDYCDIEWLALEMNRDHSVIFETASKLGISDSFVDYDGYSISSKGFLPIEFCQEYAQIIANTLFQQHKRRLYTWISPDGQHQNQIDYILCSQRWRSSIQSAKTRPGADCGSEHELRIAKFRLKWKKVEKTTRLFRYDLNQIPYDYTVEVRIRFKGLDLIDREPDELWTEVHDIVQETGIKTIPMENKCKKAK